MSCREHLLKYLSLSIKITELNIELRESVMVEFINSILQCAHDGMVFSIDSPQFVDILGHEEGW